MNWKTRGIFARSSIAITALAISCLTLPLTAQDELPKAAETFEVGGNNAFIYAAPNPAKGKPWVWYAPTIKSLTKRERKGYFEAFAKAGISIAGFDLGEVRGSPASTAKFTLFYEAMVIDNLQGLLANKVPMFAVHGDQDALVPYDLNTKLLKERYEAGGGSIRVKVIPGKGHQVDPTYFACEELVDFVIKHAK